MLERGKGKGGRGERWVASSRPHLATLINTYSIPPHLEGKKKGRGKGERSEDTICRARSPLSHLLILDFTSEKREEERGGGKKAEVRARPGLTVISSPGEKKRGEKGGGRRSTPAHAHLCLSTFWGKKKEKREKKSRCRIPTQSVGTLLFVSYQKGKERKRDRGLVLAARRGVPSLTLIHLFHPISEEKGEKRGRPHRVLRPTFCSSSHHL